jgi:hypothetical protein
MLRRIAKAAPALLLAAMFGCAGPAKLAEKSEHMLAGGQNGRAWELAIRALDKDPGNTRARAAAAAAGNAMARDWEQRIHVLAESDSMAAAEQVLQLNDFRVGAVRYAAITVSPDWAREEQALRTGAARTHYQRGLADASAKRPKRAYLHFTDAQRFVADYRDAARLADKAYDKGMTRVIVVPFSTASGDFAMGRDVAAQWRDALAQRLNPPDAHFTRVLGSAEVEQQMSVAQLDHLSREDALALARKTGADRVVWGSIGGIESKTNLHLFTDVIWRRVTEKGTDGSQSTRWVEVPIEVLSRERTVTVRTDYEVIATKGGATLAHQRTPRTTSARVVWTTFSPEGDLDAYALVSEVLRSAHPDRAKQVETRWKETCGDNTTLRMVLEARRSTRSGGRYERDLLPRFAAGAAFVFLQELPPAEDLAFAALSNGWQPLCDDLLRLDPVDEVDLGMAATGDVER